MCYELPVDFDVKPVKDLLASLGSKLEQLRGHL
jgi:hypothetical protein